MKSVYIRGNRPLYGEVPVQGSKNAALPIMAAALLVPGVSILKNCPRIADVDCMCAILDGIGCSVRCRDDEIRIDASQPSSGRLPAEYVSRMRSSVMLMGPLLGRVGEVWLAHPGGCVIGDRPVDIHIRGLERMGAVFREEEGMLHASASRLKGCVFRLAFPSVGATENLIMAAVAAQGDTCLENCAMEPEIGWLCRFLREAGADIRGNAGRILIRGGRRLHECSFPVPPDRIVAGTYLCACLSAGGEVRLKNSPTEENRALEELAARMGARVRAGEGGTTVSCRLPLVSPGTIVTGSHPGFPTDLQSPMLAVLSRVSGESRLRETIFNGRFRVVEELNRMEAGIRVQEDTAFIPGLRRLQGTRVRASELRGGAALVLAGLGAEGETVVENGYFIDRGYEDICRDLRLLGADIRAEETQMDCF